MYNTTVANTNFIIQTQTIFLAIFGYLFLKEKISKITLASIILAIAGIIMMVGNSLSPGQMVGNIAAFIMPISFAIFDFSCKKISRCRYGAVTIGCWNICYDYWLFNVSNDSNFKS